MAQLVQHLPRTQKIAGSSPARGSSSFSLEKKELSSGVVACICLVSITDYSCMYMYIYRLYHAVEVYTGMYKTVETGLETRQDLTLTNQIVGFIVSVVYVYAHMNRWRTTSP